MNTGATTGGSTNYVDYILDGLSRNPEHVAFHLEDGSSINHGDYADLILRIAHVLSSHGVGPGSTVTLLSRNRPETLAARHAINLLGARMVFPYERVSVETQTRIVSDVDTDVLIADNQLFDRAIAITDTVQVKTVLTLGPAPLGIDLLSQASTAPKTKVLAYQPKADDALGIGMSGGTTGRPKGMLMSFAIYASMITRPIGIGPDSVLLVCTALPHLAGGLTDMTLAAGGSVVLHREFNPDRVWAAIPRYRVTNLWLLPPLLYRLLDAPSSTHTDTSSLRQILYGGSAASPRRIAQAVRRFGPVLVQTYGQGEAGGFITMLSPTEHERPELLDSVGRPLPGVEITIQDTDGAALPVGQTGEICVRSTTTSNGYWRNPELSAQVWRDGWIHTGDVGHLDNDGYLRITDRTTDVFKVVGGYVYPTEVENILLAHPGIAEAAVYGVRSTDAVEQVHAAVVSRLGHTLSTDDVIAYVTERMGALYAPHAVHFLEHIPLTDVGKPDKKALRAHHH